MERLLTVLEQQAVDFEIITHDEPIRSAKHGAEFFGIEPGQTAPTLILESDRGCYLLIYAGDRGRFDFQQLATLIGVDKLHLASPELVERLTGYQVGAVAMVGIGLPCIFDRRLLRYPAVYGGTGHLTATLKIAPADLLTFHEVIAFLEDV